MLSGMTQRPLSLAAGLVVAWLGVACAEGSTQSPGANSTTSSALPNVVTFYCAEGNGLDLVGDLSTLVLDLGLQDDLIVAQVDNQLVQLQAEPNSEAALHEHAGTAHSTATARGCDPL